MDSNSALRSSTSDEWQYLAEGGAHLVFAYHGSSLSLLNKVIRVRKDRLAGSSTTETQQETLFDAARGHLSRHIIPSLVPHEILPADDRVTVSGKWIRSVLSGSVDLRPTSRLSTGSDYPIPVTMSTHDDDVEVSLVENLLGGEGDLAVEIKVSDRQRRMHAVKELYASWQATSGEGNNMRLFLSGRAARPTIHPSDSTPDIRSIESIESTVTKDSDDTARVDPAESIGMKLSDELKDQLCTAIVDALDEAHVLPLLKALQQEFDPIGIEGLGHRARQGRNGEKEPTLTEPDRTGSTSVFPESLLTDPTQSELEAVKQFWLATALQSTKDTKEELPDSIELRTLMVFHGISAIFKDCSIIIRFPGALRNHHHHQHSQPTSLNPWLDIDLSNGAKAILKIIDLDHKPMSKANKWYELDDRIWRNALQEDLCGECKLLRRRCTP
ncbi:hypothetical protein QFC22_003613 [Naganishia vaughanmartiniae]|uniref:Uncharacterized protein n=1 Tax=Naganishia vaughanmartiniae TaxID=1424756 RepID=A0ACC2X5D4_9TREE|nr:hypothetical protein QFC22_003613 [Naganishia vaughanmartiniae]